MIPMLALAFASGFIALSYEILWYRAYSFATGGDASTFGTLLGAYLLGLALGSLGAVETRSSFAQGVATHRTKPVARRALSGRPFHARLIDIAREAGLREPIVYGPVETKKYILETMSGLPATGTSGLGMRSVIGRMRSPRPAARTIAFIGASRGRSRAATRARNDARRSPKAPRARDRARTSCARSRA